MLHERISEEHSTVSLKSDIDIQMKLSSGDLIRTSLIRDSNLFRYSTGMWTHVSRLCTTGKRGLF